MGILITLYGLAAFIIIPSGMLSNNFGLVFLCLNLMFLANLFGKVLLMTATL